MHSRSFGVDSIDSLYSHYEDAGSPALADCGDSPHLPRTACNRRSRRTAAGEIGWVLFMFLIRTAFGSDRGLRAPAGGQFSRAAQHRHSVRPWPAAGTSFAHSCPFNGAVAFRVLARILSDRKLSATKLGHVAIACAALNDVVAWSVLAWIVAICRSGEAWVLGPFVILVVYTCGMFAVIRPALRGFPRGSRLASQCLEES